MIHSSHWGTFEVTGAAGRLQVRPDPADPAPARALLRNVPAMLDERVRVTRPHVRRGWLENGPGPDEHRGRAEYVPVSWDDAVALVAAELDRCRSRGPETIYAGSYGWASAGRFHHAQSQLRRFFGALGGSVRSVGNYSFGAAWVALPRILGNLDLITGATSWPVLAEHTGLFVCFGGIPAKNVQVNPGGVDRHATPGRLRAAHRRGARFVLVSPQRDDLAAELDGDWLALVPGTDTALLLALAHTLVSRGLHDPGFLRTHCAGFDDWWAYLDGATDGLVKDAAWAARVCGIDADRIVALAEAMAAHRTMISVNWSLQRARYGEQPLWAAIALACVLGQIGLPGGGIGHGYGSMAGTGGPRSEGPLPTLPIPASARTGPTIPVARVADMLLHPGEEYDFDGRRCRYPDARLVYWAGGNPFHHHQDLARLARAFGRPDTIVVHEQFWTATARHADVVLPATTTLERDDLGCARDDDALIAMQRVADPVGESRSDFAIFRALAGALGVAERFDEGRDERAWLEHLYESWRRRLGEHAPDLDFAEFWAKGRVELPRVTHERVLYADFRADPAAHPLPTPSARIEISSATVAGFGYDDCPGRPTWLVPEVLAEPPGTGAYPLLLLANNPAARLHSQLDHGAGSAASKVAGREPLRMHPRDAAARGLAAGDVVRVRSAVGSVLAGLVLSEDLRPGVVQLSTGAWFDPSAPDVATCVHGNVNALTRDVGSSRLGQGCAGALARVEVARLEGAAPPVRAYDPPVTRRRR